MVENDIPINRCTPVVRYVGLHSRSGAAPFFQADGEGEGEGEGEEKGKGRGRYSPFL